MAEAPLCVGAEQTYENHNFRKNVSEYFEHEAGGAAALVPSVVFQEFSSEVRCKDAKTKIETTLKQAGDRLKGGLNELQKAGAADPAQIIIAYNVECVPK